MGLRKRVGRMLAEHKGRYVGIVILILLGSFYFAVATGACQMVCVRGRVSLRKETHCWLSIGRRVKSDVRLRRRALSV